MSKIVVGIDEITKSFDCIEKLSCGIDPATGMVFSEDTILNAAYIKRCLKSVAQNIKRIIESKGSTSLIIVERPPKKPFSLDVDDLTKIEIVDKPITVSEFVYKINGAMLNGNMVKLKATYVTDILVKRGVLEQRIDDEGYTYKVPTEYGRQSGITTIRKTNSVGTEYYTNLYDSRAQRLVLDSIMGSS